MTSDVAVVVPCRNSGATIARALASAAAQIEPPAKVVVVDDESAEATRLHLEELAERPWPFRFTLIRLDRNVGPGEARNAGWDAVAPSVGFIAFLDADDWWMPEKLLRQRDWLRRHPVYDWSAHRCGVSERAPPGREARGSGDGFSSIDRSSLLLRNTVATPTVMVRSSVATRFRSGWRECEDLMLWADLIDGGHRGAMLDDVLAVLGRRPGTAGGLTGDSERMYRGERRVLRTLREERRISTVYAAVVGAVRWCRYTIRRAGSAR
jgi:glycosyltransferase involved in cell wall biosynthesis